MIYINKRIQKVPANTFYSQWSRAKVTRNETPSISGIVHTQWDFVKFQSETVNKTQLLKSISIATSFYSK